MRITATPCMLIHCCISGWEGFGEDPYLQGVAGSLTVKGIQSQGVVCSKCHLWIVYSFMLMNHLTFRLPQENITSLIIRS